MRNRGGDASFLIGVMLGIFVGAALAIILSPDMGDEYRAMVAGKVEEGRKSLERGIDKAEERVKGAAEGAA